MSFELPKDFLWGTATSAHQVEGNNVHSGFWVIEHLPNTIFTEPSGDAVDHYHRYKEDIALLADLGFNSYRFSVEWARVEPEERSSSALLDHYQRMLEACHAHGLTPMVTFHDFTSPRWLVSQGGWLGAETAAKFARYCARCARHFGDLMGAACTINEVNLPTMMRLSLLDDMIEGGEADAFVQAAAKAFGVPPGRLAPFLFASSEPGRV